MKNIEQWTIRPTTMGDLATIRMLASQAYWKHQHYDWFDHSALLETRPLLLALAQEKPVACLALPAEPPGAAWLRLFAVAARNDLLRAWLALWPEAESLTTSAGATIASALVLSDWLVPLVVSAGFAPVDSVIVLEWFESEGSLCAPATGDVRPMQAEDLSRVAEIDQLAFAPTWRNSPQFLIRAFKQAALATVTEFQDQLIGYQISTVSPFGAHLARLAVVPQWQGRGVGRKLVQNLLAQLSARGFRRVTVNTQADNPRALGLYRQLGFRQTQDRFPVYQKALSKP